MVVRRRLAEEQGTIRKDAPERVALLYPSPYRVGMSSLGFQTIYREINASPKRVAERGFLPDHLELGRRSKTARQPTRSRQRHHGRSTLLTYESERPVGGFPVVALSVAYELELAGVVQVLELAGIPALANERDASHPFVLCGGPLTFANPLPLAPFADAILMGEADQTVHAALDILSECSDRTEACSALAREIASCFVPSLHGEHMPALERCSRDVLPARGQICTRHTELGRMFLVEAARGCSHRCAYCVMRGSREVGMRPVAAERILEAVPAYARRVGLVGAAVSEHRQIVEIVQTLAAQGREVGLSSLRPDRVDEELMAALAKAGYKTLTTALDGPSQRLRDKIGRRVSEEHILRAARLARKHGLEKVKLYVMAGLPDEGDADIAELVRFSKDVSRIHSLSLAVSPFVPKRNTPLAAAPFAGIAALEDRLRGLRRALGRDAEMGSTSARWAWVEFMLAQGGVAQGLAALHAVREGGTFRDWKRALELSR